MSTAAWASTFASEPDRPLSGLGVSLANVTTKIFAADSPDHRKAKESRAKQRLHSHLRSERTGRIGPVETTKSTPISGAEAYDSHCLDANRLPCCSAVQAILGKGQNDQALTGQDRVTDGSSLEGVKLGLPTLEQAGWFLLGEEPEDLKEEDGGASALDSQELPGIPEEDADASRHASEEASEAERRSSSKRSVQQGERRRGSKRSQQEAAGQHGWGRRSGSKRAPEEDLQEQHYATAMECLGLEPVARRADGVTVPGRLLTFKKASVRGGEHEVRALLRTLEKITHVNAVQLLQACESEEFLYLIYEECAGAGHLFMRLSTRRLLSATEAAVLLQELAAVVTFCDKQRLSVLDWSVWGVMNQDFIALSPAKIFGIGLAGVLYDGADGAAEGASPPSLPLRSTFRFRPPELVRALEHHTSPYHNLEVKERRSVDIWSLAAIVFHCLSGHAPFSGGTATEVHGNAMEVKVVDVRGRLEGLPAEAITLLERCMHVLPVARPMASAVVAYPWVTTEVGRSRGNDINAIIDRLSRFVEQQSIMRALGKLMMQVLKPDKERSIRAMFRTIDATGDGEISCHELIALAAHRREEVRSIFKGIGSRSHGDACITLADFSLANVFAEGILTHRMLMEAFNTMDDDNSGCISAVELYQSLRELDDGITWADVCGFIREAEKDWNFQLTFDEFCDHFPTAKLNDEVGAKRRMIAELQQACQITYALLLHHLDNWVKQMDRVQQRLEKVAHDNKEFESAGSIKVCGKLFRVLGEARQLLGSLPVASIPAEAHQLLGKRSGAGISTLDEFLRQREQDWIKDMGSLQQIANEAVEEDQTFIRRYEVDRIVTQATALVQEVLDWISDYSNEQADNLEASSELEGACPSRPWSRRAIASVKKEAPNAAVDPKDIMEVAPTRAGPKMQQRRKVTVQTLLEKFGIPLQTGCACPQVFGAS